MKKWWTDPKDFDKLSFCVYAAEIRGEEERPYVLIPAAQWEELEAFIAGMVSPEVGMIDYGACLDKLIGMIKQIGGAEDGNEGKE